MIIAFNPNVFEIQDPNIQSCLAKILEVLMDQDKDIHFIDIESVKAIFYNEENKYIFHSNIISTEYLSPNLRKSLQEFIGKKLLQPTTNLHKKHLSYIVIGIDKASGEVCPINAYKIITERSKIIIENGINDWKFIKGICQKYSGSKSKRKSIYELLNKAIKREIIEPHHSGGHGDIEKITKQLIESRYQHIFKYNTRE